MTFNFKESRDSLAKKFRSGGRDWAVFLLSLLLAGGIWLISNLSKDYSDTVSVRVEAEASIEGHSDHSSNTAVVLARCRTSGFNLLRARYRRDMETVRVHFDRQDIRHVSGEEYLVAGAALNGYTSRIFGEGTDVEAFISDTLSFLFPYENYKKVPVEMVRELSFRPQYMASGPVKLDPDSVTVYGEAVHLENIDRVYTSALTASDVSSDIHGSLKINKIKGVRISDEDVSFSLPVTRYVEVASTMNVKVRNAPSGRRLQVFPSVVDVTFRCAFPLLVNPSVSVSIYVDYNDFATSRNGRCVLRCDKLPRGVISMAPSQEVVDCIDMDAI